MGQDIVVVLDQSPAEIKSVVQPQTVLVSQTLVAAGKSAYESWLSLGNVGTEEDFINSLGGGGGLDEAALEAVLRKHFLI